MTDEMKQRLEESGRGDMVKTFEVIQAGFAGILQNGNIVDRREFPDAVPIQENEMLNVPEPREIEKGE